MPTSSESLVKKSLADYTYSKIMWRIMPIIFLCALFSYVDRLNVGYAQLQMKDMLKFSDAIYGLGASLFFIGYFIFELPSNLLLQKIGTRKTLLRIMVLWGIASASTMLVKTPTEYYIVRFLVGVFEAGFFPGVLLYLTLWFPPARRARAVSIVFLAGVLAGMVAGGISGWILQNMNGVNGWQGWQWMFLLEGLPSCILGVVAYFVLSERPVDAPWLNSQQKDLVASEIAAAAVKKKMSDAGYERSPFKNPMVYLLSFTVFGTLCGNYSLLFWLPTVIHSLGITNLQHIGLYSMIPSAAGGIALILYSRHSDARQERRIHYIVATLVAATSLCLSTLTEQSLGLSIALFALAQAGISGALPIFWAMATAQLSARDSVAGIALITTLGNLSGAVSPYVLGLIKTITGSFANGLYLIALIMIAGAFIVWRAVPANTVPRHSTVPSPHHPNKTAS